MRGTCSLSRAFAKSVTGVVATNNMDAKADSRAFAANIAARAPSPDHQVSNAKVAEKGRTSNARAIKPRRGRREIAAAMISRIA